MSLQGKFNSMYYKNGRPVYVYNVTGTKKELEQYQAVQGINYKTDPVTNLPLFWLPGMVNGVMRLVAPTIDISITGGDNPRAVYDDSKQRFNLMNKVNENLAVEIAKVMAQQWVNPAQAGGSVALTQPASTTAIEAPVTENAAVGQLEGVEAGAGDGTEQLG